MSLDSGSVGSITFTLTAQDLASRVFLEVQNAMANLQRAAQQAPVALDQTANAEEEVAASSSKASKEVTTLGSSLGESARRAGEFALAFLEFKGIEDVLGGIKSAFIDFNAQLQQAQITWSVFLGSQSDATQMLDQLQQFASITPFHFQDLEEGARTLLAMGVTASQIMPEMQDIATAAAASPNGAAGLQRITYALAELQAQGQIDARIMRELTMDSVPAWTILADAMNLPIEQVRKLVTAGQVSSTTFMAAFHEWVQKNEGDLLAQQAQTFTGALTTLSDNLTIIGAQASKPLFNRIAADIANLGTQSIALAQGPLGTTLANDLNNILNLTDQLDPKLVEVGVTFAATAAAVNLLGNAIVALNVELAGSTLLSAFGAPLVGMTEDMAALEGVSLGLGGAFEALGATVLGLLGPIGLVAVGVAALAVGYETNFLGMRDATDKTTSSIVTDTSIWIQAFGQVGDAIGKLNLPNLGQMLGVAPQIEGLQQLATATGAVSDKWNILTGNAQSLLQVLPLVGPEFKALAAETDQMGQAEQRLSQQTAALNATAQEAPDWMAHVTDAAKQDAAAQAALAQATEQAAEQAGAAQASFLGLDQEYSHLGMTVKAATADTLTFAESLAKIGDAVSALGGASALASGLVSMDPAAQAASASVSDAAQKVNDLRSAMDANSAATSNAQRALQNLEQQGQKISATLSEAKQKLQDLLKTPLVGETAADNGIFAAQQRLERLQAQRDQIAMSEGPSRGGRSRPDPRLTSIDQEIQREQARLDLLQKQKDLTFAPQHRAIDLAANGTPKELTAGQEIAQIKDTKAQITDLTAQQKTNADQTAAQKQTVDDLEGSQRALSTAMSAAQSQLVAAQSTQDTVNKGLQAQYDWLVKTRPEIEKLGPAYSDFVDTMDAKERVLAAATANFVKNENASTKQALLDAEKDLEDARKQEIAFLTDNGSLVIPAAPTPAATHSPAGRAARINGFAGGGAFTVGGTGGTDSQLVQFMATPGERVSISPYSGGGGSGAMQVIVNIPQIVIQGANDATGVANQLAGEIARALDSVVPTQVRSPNVSRRLLPGAM